mgnify:CR=1 FL=1
MSLRVEVVQRQLRNLLQKLMNHSLNKAIFNTPVNPSELNLPDYARIVTSPMDLGTVKTRLQSIQYDDLNDFVKDVRLTFQNAMKYNPVTHAVHLAAAKLLREFEDDYNKIFLKSEKEFHKRKHSCQVCDGRTCELCGEACLKLDPAIVVCHGTCGQRVRRGNFFYVTKDGSNVWCQKCFGGLNAVLPTHTTEQVINLDNVDDNDDLPSSDNYNKNGSNLFGIGGVGNNKGEDTYSNKGKNGNLDVDLDLTPASVGIVSRPRAAKKTSSALSPTATKSRSNSTSISISNSNSPKNAIPIIKDTVT